MKYKDVVKEAKCRNRTSAGKIKFVDCNLWKDGDQINLWTYWQGFQLKDIDEKGVDILLVGQDWGSPESNRNKEVCKCIKDIQDGIPDAVYLPTVSPTDQRLAFMFQAFGEKVDITLRDPGMRLFFTNYSLGYRGGSETGGMTKTIMRQDKELFEMLVKAIKPRIIICLGKITFEVVADQMARDFTQHLKNGKPFRAEYPKNKSIPVYGVAHPGSRGLYNVGGDENVMRAAWDVIAKEYARAFREN